MKMVIVVSGRGIIFLLTKSLDINRVIDSFEMTKLYLCLSEMSAYGCCHFELILFS